MKRTKRGQVVLAPGEWQMIGLTHQLVAERIAEEANQLLATLQAALNAARDRPTELDDDGEPLTLGGRINDAALGTIDRLIELESELLQRALACQRAAVQPVRRGPKPIQRPVKTTNVLVACLPGHQLKRKSGPKSDVDTSDSRLAKEISKAKKQDPEISTIELLRKHIREALGKGGRNVANEQTINRLALTRHKRLLAKRLLDLPNSAGDSNK